MKPFDMGRPFRTALAAAIAAAMILATLTVPAMAQDGPLIRPAPDWQPKGPVIDDDNRDAESFDEALSRRLAGGNLFAPSFTNRVVLQPSLAIGESAGEGAAFDTTAFVEVGTGAFGASIFAMLGARPAAEAVPTGIGDVWLGLKLGAMGIDGGGIFGAGLSLAFGIATGDRTTIAGESLPIFADEFHGLVVRDFSFDLGYLLLAGATTDTHGFFDIHLQTLDGFPTAIDGHGTIGIGFLLRDWGIVRLGTQFSTAFTPVTPFAEFGATIDGHQLTVRAAFPIGQGSNPQLADDFRLTFTAAFGF